MKILPLLALSLAGLLIAGCSDKSPRPVAANTQDSPASTPGPADSPALPATATPDTEVGNLVIKGSDTLGETLVPQLAADFKLRHPGASFDITAEGSTTGVIAIIESTANIGMSSRPAKATEFSLAKSKGVDLQPILVAYDGIALVVNAKNPLTNLSKSQIEKLFTGEITDWSAVGGNPGAVSVYTRNSSSGTYGVFKELALNKRDYAPSSRKMNGNDQIAAEVAKDPNGIGYVGLSQIDAAGVKPIHVDGIAPSETTVKNKTYALARPTFYYVNGTPTGLTAKFIDHTLGAEGQNTVRKLGFVPVK